MSDNLIIRIAIVILAMTLLSSCQNSQPIKIGFVAGLSGKSADLGGAGRNGAILAIEQRNATGGIHGRPVELVIKDAQQTPEIMKQVIAELVKEDIELIIGPMTSSMATAAIPLINASKSILLSPTATTTQLTGKDDNFLRVISSTAAYSSKNARYQYEKLGTRTVSVIYDENNNSYAESWLRGFRATFESLGGKVGMLITFNSAKSPVYHQLAMELVSAKSDSLLIISNAVDAAMLCQQINIISPNKQLLASEWASTERFIELAGATAEGVTIAQFLNRNDTSSRYLEFLQAYQKRFQQTPGFAGLAGYDAAMVALDAYTVRQQRFSLKETIISVKKFQGVQQPLLFDKFGDSKRKTYITVVRNGKYVTVE
ncbi:MAG: branched-chain amino acid transport system substrate-binding protein [Desulforhopalus sp.]|jgi:branched-chain amino acid transport system substrate-binding protein